MLAVELVYENAVRLKRPPEQPYKKPFKIATETSDDAFVLSISGEDAGIIVKLLK